MRRANQEIQDKKVLEEILSGAVICRLALMDGDRPYILPFNYGFQDGSIYIHSAPEGKKIDLLHENNQVCFEVEDTVRIIEQEKACQWTTLYRSVVGYGTVEILTDDRSRQTGLEIIMAQHGAPGLIHFDPGNIKRMVILKLSIETLTGKQSSNWGRI